MHELVLVCVFYVIITRVHHSKKYYRYRCIFIRICVHSRMYSCICISSKPLNPHIHVYTNMRSLLWSEGCFLRTSIVVSNCVIHLYTQIRICLYVSWAEWVGPLRYSLIRSYWLSQTGQSAQNRSVPAYYNKQLLPSWPETPLWDFVWLRIGCWVTYHNSPSVYGAFSVSACIYDWRARWCNRIYHL